MATPHAPGRVIGLVMLAQMTIAPFAYFRLLPSLTDPGTLETAAAQAFQVRSALLLLLAAGGMSAVIAVALVPLMRRLSERIAFTLLLLSAAGLATVAAETVAARNLLSVSLELAAAAAPADTLRALGGLARSAWRSAHFTNLLVSHAMYLVLWLTLFRFALVNRWLGAFGAAAAVLSTASLALPLLGLPFSFRPIAPVALANFGLIAWLVARGLDLPPSGRPADG